MKDKILITGAGGFIGSHLVEDLLHKGYRIKAFVRYNSKNNWGWLEGISNHSGLEIIAGDLRDYDSVLNSMNDCHTVFHLAALIGIPYSYISPLAYIKTNIEGTYNIIEASRKLNIENVIITSTSETYGSAQYSPIDEKHPMVGQSPYSASKISADELSLSYYRSFDLPVKIVRPFNTYGPRQSARAIVPSIIIQILSGKKEIKLGNLSPVRDLTYVKDTVKGFMEIFKCDKLFGEVTNIGTGTGIEMQELFNFICDLMGTKPIVVKTDERIRTKKSEVQKLICNNSKLKAFTNWQYDYSLEEGLLKTIDWIKNNPTLFKNHIYNI